MISGRTAQSQHPNVYRDYKSHSMECKLMLFITNHIPCLWGLFKFFSQRPHWFLQLWRCFIKWYVMRKKWSSTKLRPLCIHNGGCFETLNLLHVSTVAVVAKCLDFVMFHMKQNKKTQTSSQDCAVWTGNHLYTNLNQFNGVQVLLFELLYSHANILKQVLEVVIKL